MSISGRLLVVCLFVVGCGTNSGTGGQGGGGGNVGGNGGTSGNGGTGGGGNGGTGGGGMGGHGGGGGMGGHGGSGGAGGTGGSGGGSCNPGGLGPGAPSYTFGSHPMAYPSDVLLPSGSQGARDTAVANAYDAWKARYVKQGCGGYYVFSNGGTGQDVGDEVSEGHGYGMVITALMAGHDPDARTIFDGMYAFYKKFPTSSDPDLMSWTVNVAGGCKIPTDQADSATDGDLDIAYALLLAERQWPGNGYLQKALTSIAAVERGDMHPTTHQPMLGNWVDSTAPEFYSTRPSDFMLDHFRAFARATCAPSWSQGVDSVYGLIATMQARPDASQTGLLPDFIVNTNTTPVPAAPNFLEGPGDGQYSWNACRVPWRITTDYIVSRDARAKAAMQKLDSWIIAKTGGDPNGIITGYTLDGNTGATGSGGSGAFTAPFGVAAMVGGNQAWLDKIWSTRQINEDYYADSITLMSMIVMSGNWWAP